VRSFIVDTNVVVSGLLTSQVDSPPARILDAMLAGRLRFVLSTELLTEYRAVLLRPVIAARHGLSSAEIDTVLERIVLHAEVREPAEGSKGRPPDLGDAHLWALMDAEPAAVLVTGDRALIDAPPSGRSVLSPAAALKML